MPRAPLAIRLRLAICMAFIAAAAPLASAGPARQVAPPGEAAEDDAPLVEIRLRDGSIVVGRISREDAAEIQLVTPAGAELRVPRSAIASIDPGSPAPAQAAPLPAADAAPAAPPVAQSRGFSRDDPNHTRLMFAPTGRPLGKGQGQLSDHYVIFPGFSYGLTGNLSVMGGVSVVPGVGLDEQLFYVAPRLAFQTSRRTAFSVGALYATVAEGSDRLGAGIAFAVGTFGEPRASFSAGVGWGYLTDDGEFDLARRPILMLGGEYQLSDSLALVSENWLFLDDDFRLADQPFGLALRFFGDRISVDLGVILVGALLDDGFPIPWLSFSYRFGDSGPAAGARVSSLPPAYR